MLKLTKKADYGLIALKHLAVVSQRSVGTASSSAKEIADHYHMPLPLLSKVLQTLGKTGFLVSVQGTNGGYKESLRARVDAIVAQVIEGIPVDPDAAPARRDGGVRR